jgi:hypothetical protein
MDRGINIALGKQLFKFLIRFPELDIMIKDETGDYEKNNQDQKHSSCSS